MNDGMPPGNGYFLKKLKAMFLGYGAGVLSLRKDEKSVEPDQMIDKDMPRKAVVNKIAAENKLSKVEAEHVMRSVLLSIAEELAERSRFHIAEIGSITVAERPPRRYFNPRTRKQAVSQGDTSLKINISKQMRRRLGRK